MFSRKNGSTFYSELENRINSVLSGFILNMEVDMIPKYHKDKNLLSNIEVACLRQLYK